jgi:hypothetical protein
MNLKNNGLYLLSLAIIYLASVYIFTIRFTGLTSSVLFGITNAIIITLFFYISRNN